MEWSLVVLEVIRWIWQKNLADGLNRFSSRLIGILDISRTFVQISRQSWTLLSLIKFELTFKGTNCCNTKKKARKWLICYSIATHYMYFHHSQIIQNQNDLINERAFPNFCSQHCYTLFSNLYFQLISSQLVIWSVNGNASGRWNTQIFKTH